METPCDPGAVRRAGPSPSGEGAVLTGLPALPRERGGGTPRIWGRLALPLPRTEPGLPEHPFFPERRPFWTVLAEARSGDLLERLDRRR